MTRKDFELIAGAFAATRWPSDKLGAATHNGGLDALALNMAVRLGQTNPRFDTQRFLAACGVPA